MLVSGRKVSLEVGTWRWQGPEDQLFLSDKTEKGVQAEETVCAKVLGHHLSMRKAASQKLASWETPPVQKGQQEAQRHGFEALLRSLGFIHRDKTFGTGRLPVCDLQKNVPPCAGVAWTVVGRQTH